MMMMHVIIKIMDDHHVRNLFEASAAGAMYFGIISQWIRYTINIIAKKLFSIPVN
jgi:hypothetical protein